MAVSVLNSFAATTYLDGEIFTGEYFDVLRYAQIVVNITTTSATNSYDIRCYYSNDAITVNSIETFLITNQLNHIETFNATNRFIKIELEPHSTLLNLQLLTILKNQSQIQDVNCTIVQSEVLLVSNTQETALFIQADNTHAINVIADEDHPVNVKADITRPLYINNTQAQAVFIQADNTHAINVIADEDHPVNVKADTTRPLFINNTLANAIYIQADNTHAINVIADEDHPVNVKADMSRPLYVNNTQEQAIYIQADNTHAINVIADEDHPVNVKADITRPLYVNNTQAQALFIQADNTHAINVIVNTLPPIAITNTSFDVSNFPASQPVSGTVDIGNYPASVNVVNTLANSLYIQADTSHPIYAVINTLPSIAITNTGFNSNITNSFITVKNKPTYSVSLNSIGLTSQTIRTSAGVLHTVVISSNPMGIAFDYLKFYNSSSATDASTPLMTIPIKAGESLTFVADMNFSAGLCVRATDIYNSGGYAPISLISITVFITGYSE